MVFSWPVTLKLWNGSISALCLGRITRSPPGTLREVPFAWLLPAGGGFVSHGGNPNSLWLFLSHGHPQLDDLGYPCQETFISLLVFLHGNESHFIPIQSTSMCSRHPNPKSTQPGSNSLSQPYWLDEAMACYGTVKQWSPEPPKKQSSSRYNSCILKLTIPNIGWQ